MISSKLYAEQTLDQWKQEIPDEIGIIVVDPSDGAKETVKRAKLTGITTDVSNMLKNSLIRTLFYQNQNDDWYLRKK